MSCKNRFLFAERRLFARGAIFATLVLCATSSCKRPATPKTGAPTVSSIAASDSIPRTNVSHDDADMALLMDRVDASNDAGWKSEVLAQEAKLQLRRLADMLRDPSTITAKRLAKLAIAEIQITPLRPRDLDQVFRDGSLSVWRSKTSQGNPRTTVGLEAAAESMRELVRALNDTQDIRVECKVVGLELAERDFETQVLFHSIGIAEKSRTQQNAKWTCGWTLARDERPMLKTLRLNEFEEIRDVGSGVRFVDLTASLLGMNRSFQQQLSRGIDHWLGRLETNYGVDLNGNQGIAVGDADGDGLDDIYVCQQGGLPNRLFLRKPEGTLVDASAQAGVDWMELTRSALLIDLDNDRDQDLVLCHGWYLLVMLNDGKGHFQVANQYRCRGDSYSMSAADYDLDGDLDIYVCGRDPDPRDDQFVGILGSPLPYHDANNGAPNILWQNNGNGQLQDVTSQVGLDTNNRRFSYAAAWADYDNDRDMDLYVANDFGRNNLYENRNGTFTDVAATQGVEDVSAGMSVTWGDCDEDGWLDIYISNMYSSAGNRIAYQRSFQSQASAQTRQDFQRHAKGNSLFRNPAGRGFRDTSQSSGVTMGRWAWGSKFVDLNNDSLEDLYVANGFITTEDTGDL